MTNPSLAFIVIISIAALVSGSGCTDQEAIDQNVSSQQRSTNSPSPAPSVDGNGDQPENGVSLRLVQTAGASGFSRFRYMPGQGSDPPALTLEIVNGSKSPLAVPCRYEAEVLRLWGGSLDNDWPLLLVPTGRLDEEEEIEFVEVAPGERRLCFSFRLSEILEASISDSGSDNEKPWYWSWWAHPKTPFSPIHKRRGDGFVSVAVLWAEVVVDNQSLRTEPIVVEVECPSMPEEQEQQEDVAPSAPSKA